MRKEFFDEIFKANKTVIIPGLGAFTRNSPSDKATFNSFLKFNDGLLAGYLAKKLSISVADAGKLLEANVKQIVQSMSANGKVSIGGMGHFTKGKDGKFAFMYDQTAEATVPFETKVGAGIQENRVVHEIKKDKPKEEVKKEPEKKPVVPEVKKEEKKPVVEAKKEEPKKEEVKKEDPKNKFIKPKPEKKPKDPNAKKKKFPVLWIVIIVLLGGAGTFAGLQWEMVKGWFATNKAVETHGEKEEPKDEPKVDTTAAVVPQDSTGANGNNVKEEPIKEEPVKETPKKETPKKETPKKEIPKKETPPPAVTYGDFHVIVNCYQSEANATNMVSKLSAKGFSAQNLGNRGGFFMVSAGSASSKEEASSILEKARGEFPKAWIYNGK